MTSHAPFPACSFDDVLKTALRDIVRRSRSEAELRELIAADTRFIGEPSIHIELGYRGTFLSPSSTSIMVHAHNGETISI